jgi:hypothetical protein
VRRAAAPAPVARPSFGVPDARPQLPVEEYERRLAALGGAVDADWVVVYGDREHFANLAFACGFDPRFEEGLLLLGGGRRVLVVGNEGVGYAELVSVPLEVVLCPSLSLMGQRRSGGVDARGRAPRGGPALAGSAWGSIGWKSLGAEEWEPAAAGDRRPVVPRRQSCATRSATRGSWSTPPPR